jgi:putative endonuclease
MSTNYTGTVLYTGVTNNLIRRMQEHKEALTKSSFSSKYNVNKLVWYEVFEDINAAISREKQIKSWKRKKKEALVAENNKELRDLFDELL